LQGKLPLQLPQNERSSVPRKMRHIMDILHKWGIHTLGQFAALEKQDVSTRLGPLAVEMWDRANGTATRLLRLVQPPEVFRGRV
jgi:hypothetical protein